MSAMSGVGLGRGCTFVKVALPVAMFVLVASSAAAQSGFVEGGLSRDVRRFSREGSASAFDGTVNGIWMNGSGFVTPRLSVGVELDAGGEVTFDDTVSVTVTGRPSDITTTYMSRRRTVSALAGIHTSSSQPIRLGVYGGLSFTAFRRQISSNAPPIVLNETPVPSVFDERATDAIVGIDVAIRVAPYVAIVPALRAQGLSLSGDLSGFSIRPSIGARVTF